VDKPTSEPPDLLARTNALIAYHSTISAEMTKERTNLESALIPVSAYIVIAAVEAFHRWPEIVATIDAALPAEEIGRRARRPGCRVNAVHLWSAANIYLVGRKVLVTLGMAADALPETHTVLDFWERATTAYRGDGTRQAWDAGLVARPYDGAVIETIVAGLTPVEDEEARTSIARFNALLVSYLFLLYFDTRVGTADSGPWTLPDGGTLLVRDFYQLGRSHFWWSDVASGLPYQNLTAGLILDGVDVGVNDWGTLRSDPADYLPHLRSFGLFTTDDAGPEPGALRPVPLDELASIASAAKRAQAQHYRNVAAMSRDEKIRCGAYVYFSFLRPFAEEAGVADDIDWTVPRDTIGPVYDALSLIEGGNAAPEEGVDYYGPIELPS
jgi:hypothetical protein